MFYGVGCIVSHPPFLALAQREVDIGRYVSVPVAVDIVGCHLLLACRLVVDEAPRHRILVYVEVKVGIEEGASAEFVLIATKDRVVACVLQVGVVMCDIERVRGVCHINEVVYVGGGGGNRVSCLYPFPFRLVVVYVYEVGV